MSRAASAVVLLAAILASTSARALKVPDQPLGRVSDFAHALGDADRARLERELATYATGTTQQIAIALFPSLEEEALEDFTIRLAERWRIGGKGSNDGVLVVLFMKEHKSRIEVGYGLEAVLPDARAARILREVMAPRLKHGQLADALSAGTAAIHEAIAPPTETKPADKPGPRLSDLPWIKGKPDDRVDPRVYDFPGELGSKGWLKLEGLARELERDNDLRYVVAIFATRNEDSEKVAAELQRRWDVEHGRVYMLCSYLDSVMEPHVSPALHGKLSPEAAGQITIDHIRAFYAEGDVVGGLSSGLYAADTALTGGSHPTLTPSRPPPPAVDDPEPVRPPSPKLWYLPDSFNEDVRARLLELPWPLRVPLLALLLPMALLLILPFPFILVGCAVLVLGVIGPWAKRERERTDGAPYAARALARLGLVWGPFLVAGLWTLSVLWIALVVLGTALWLFGLFARGLPEATGRGYRSTAGAGYSASSDSWSSSDSSSSDSSWSDSFSGGGGDFGGGGASGDW